MKLRAYILSFILLFAAVAATAQNSALLGDSAPSLSVLAAGRADLPNLTESSIPTPRMAPELALQTYQSTAQRQLTTLGMVQDVTVVEAAIPTTGQKGRFELRRSFLAPRSLAYGAVKFVGDTFVKTNIITKLLQAEVDHVEKGESRSTAITPENYKFSYKGLQQINGQAAYEFHVKPRKKRQGLFKGKIFLAAATGHILRAEGTFVKSPSVFVKKIDFSQDYEDVAGFSLPAHMHSVANTRMFGKAVVDISHSDYNAQPLGGDSSSAAPAAISSEQ